jgi:phage repressor protein C with HTH and peptisase S24 domain
MIRAETQYPPVAIFANFGRMKPPEIRSRLRATGRTQTALAAHLGKSKDSVSRLVAGQRSMDIDELAQIKEFFGDDQPAAPTTVQIPVYGYAGAGGDDRVVIASDQVLEYIEIPAGMVRGEAIAVRVAGESMYPRLFSGEMVIVERNVPPVRNKDAVIELKDGSALVKEYRGQKDGVVFLFQYNPEGEVRVPADQVRAMHAVKYRR